MRRTLLACVLLLGCGTRAVVYEPCPMPDAGDVAVDAGAIPAEDAGPIETDAGAAPFAEHGEITDVTACRLMGYAADHLAGACRPHCPWPGIAGPGITPQHCDLAAVLRCVDAVAAVNECPWLDSAVADNCDPDACIEVP